MEQIETGNDLTNDFYSTMPNTFNNEQNFKTKTKINTFKNLKQNKHYK